MSSGGYQKTSWPELVGSPGHYAHDMIHKDRPDVQIPVLVVGTEVPPGFDDKRVRLFVHQDFNLKVALTGGPGRRASAKAPGRQVVAGPRRRRRGGGTAASRRGGGERRPDRVAARRAGG